MTCTFCIDAPALEFDYCRVCGRGLPVPERQPSAPVALFMGGGCGHPPDPVALFTPDVLPYCHCGWVLERGGGHTVEGAPGPVVQCDKCGCHVAIPDTPSDEERGRG